MTSDCRRLYSHIALSPSCLGGLTALLVAFICDGTGHAAELDAAKFAAIGPRMQQFVDEGTVAGAVTVVGNSQGIVQLRCGRLSESGIEAGDAEGCRLPHRVDDQADHGHRDHDLAGRGEAVGRRSGREAPAGIQGADARREARRRPRDPEKAAAADHDPRLARRTPRACRAVFRRDIPTSISSGSTR